jgi:acetate kinase
MRMFRQVLGDTPLVAAFEPGFHHTIPLRRQRYAVPPEWAERYGVRRYGYHGASHCYIATRMAELMGADKARRIISCHLGGSSSVCAIRDGQSVANSFGLSAQSGLPHGARAGEFDPFALSLLSRQGGLDLDEMLTMLGTQSGLAAVSGTSGDMRDIHEAAAGGSEQAKLAIEVLVTAIRDYLGAYLVELGGADAIVFTGGIGQKDPYVRVAVCSGLEFCGIAIDEGKNEAAAGECRIESAKSSSAVWVMPTNEELIVARQAAELLASGS